MTTIKRTKIIYWILTALLAAFIIMSSVPDILSVPDAVEVFRHLGYPLYLLSFLGVAKILAAVALLTPGFPRIKEWAYAGICFDLAGALYSAVSVHDPISGVAPAVIGLVLLAGAYIFYQKKLNSYEHNK